MLTNENGDILFLHESVFPEEVDWLEFDEADGDRLFVYYKSGNRQEIGFNIDDQTADNLYEAKEVTLALVQNKSIVSQQKIHFVFKEI